MVDKVWIENQQKSGLPNNRKAIFSPDYPYVHVPFDDLDKLTSDINTKLQGATANNTGACTKSGIKTLQRYIRCEWQTACSEIKGKLPTNLIEVELTDGQTNFKLEFDANELLDDAKHVTGNHEQEKCFLTLMSDNKADSKISDKWVFGAIAMKQLVVEYDYSEAFADAGNYTKYKNKVGLGLIDMSATPTPNPDNQPNNNAGSPGLIIVLIVGILFLIIVGYAAYKRCTKKKSGAVQFATGERAASQQ